MQTRDLAQSSQNAIVQNDYTTLGNFVPSIAKDDPEIAYVLVADKDGVVLAHSDDRMRGKPLTDPVAKEMLATKDAVTKEVSTAAGKEYVFRPPGRAGRRRAKAPSSSPTRSRCSTRR